jgi:hypothetical protein
MGIATGTAITSSQRLRDRNQVGPNDLPDLFKPIDVWICFTQFKPH